MAHAGVGCEAMDIVLVAAGTEIEGVRVEVIEKMKLEDSLRSG